MTENDQVLLELKNGSFELSKLKFKPKVEKAEKPKEKVEKAEKPKNENLKENKSELSFVNKTKTVADIEKENKKKKK
jgi:hypothetical protein